MHLQLHVHLPLPMPNIFFLDWEELQESYYVLPTMLPWSNAILLNQAALEFFFCWKYSCCNIQNLINHLLSKTPLKVKAFLIKDIRMDGRMLVACYSISSAGLLCKQWYKSTFLTWVHIYTAISWIYESLKIQKRKTAILKNLRKSRISKIKQNDFLKEIVSYSGWLSKYWLKKSHVVESLHLYLHFTQ